MFMQHVNVHTLLMPNHFFDGIWITIIIKQLLMLLPMDSSSGMGYKEPGFHFYKKVFMLNLFL